MCKSVLLSASVLASLALAGCGLINVGKEVVTAVKGGQPLDQTLATISANDTAAALGEAQQIGDANSIPCLQKANSVAAMIEKDGPSAGVATDMERAIALKQVEIVCAGPMINAGKSLSLP